MSGLATMSAAQWIGLFGLALFSIVLVWSLIQGHKAPPDRR
jgi:hypothetical protein